MSPAKLVTTLDGETRLQLTAGSALALIATTLVNLGILAGIALSVDRRIGAIEASVVRLGDRDAQHDKAIDRLEAKMFPTATIQGAHR